jgi:uncharacterized Tic20 family protein
MEEEGRSWAILCHFGLFVGGFFLPLAMYLAQRGRNRFAEHHAAEALNFQLTLLIPVAAYMVTFFVTFFRGIDGSEPPGWFFVAMAGYGLIFLCALGLSVVGAIRAGQGRWWRYPVRIPFVRVPGPDPDR